MKKIVHLVAGILLAGMLGATALTAETPAVVRVAALNGPSAVGMAYLFENHPDLGGVESVFENAGAADVFLPKIIKGEYDIGILPPNAAAKVYNANKGRIIMAGVCGNGMLTVITRNPAIKTMKDLNGKTVYVAGQGATPEYMMRYLADKNGVSVNLDYSIPTAELAAAIASGKIETACVPEPFATVACMNSPDVRRAIDLQKEWGPVNYPMTVIVVRAEFAQKYPETVRAFLAAYKQSIEWTNANPAEAGKLVEKHTLGLKAAIVAKSVPYANFTYASAEEARPQVENLLKVFLTFAPESIGGKLPDAGFYFK